VRGARANAAMTSERPRNKHTRSFEWR
jgi:hypothetical protein